MPNSEIRDGRAQGTSTNEESLTVIDNRPLRNRTVGGVQGAEDRKSSALSDSEDLIADECVGGLLSLSGQ